MAFGHTYYGSLQGTAQVIQKAEEARKAIEVLEYPRGESGGRSVSFRCGMNAI